MDTPHLTPAMSGSANSRDAVKEEKQTPYLLGEKSARYCAMPVENIRRARETLPDAKLILMTRDPVSRHWAHAKKFFAKRKLINADQAVLSMKRQKLLAFFEEMRPLGEFSKIIDSWTSVYPKDRLLVLSGLGEFLRVSDSAEAAAERLTTAPAG